MGADYMVFTKPGGEDPGLALALVWDELRAQGYTDREHSGDWERDGVPWPDPFAKGWVEVWDKPVPACAAEWMRGWIAQHPPPGVKPGDKWGPWMTFRLDTGEWVFFGWVNT